MLTKSWRTSSASPRETIWRYLHRIQIAIDLGAITAIAVTIAAFGAAYLVTLSAGGTHTVFPHLFYVPVLLAALRWGPIAGAISGAASGILCGPLMPLSVEYDLAQPLGGWLTRMGFFIGIGLLSGGIMQRLHERHQRGERLHRDAIHAFVNTIDAKCSYTARHSERVAHFAAITAQALGMPTSWCEDVRGAGLVHDIGKLWIPGAVLEKLGPLTDEEWELIKQHPVRSEEFLRGVEEFQPYLKAVRGHHERYDGTGYPDGLEADEIPLGARVLAVADAFEAMTAERPYRPSLQYNEAISELEHNAGSQFDPAVVRAFCIAIRREVGSDPTQATHPHTR